MGDLSVLITLLSGVLLLPRGADAWWGQASPKKTALEVYGPWIIRIGVALAFITGVLVALYLVMQARRRQCGDVPSPNPGAK